MDERFPPRRTDSPEDSFEEKEITAGTFVTIDWEETPPEVIEEFFGGIPPEDRPYFVYKVEETPAGDFAWLGTGDYLTEENIANLQYWEPHGPTEKEEESPDEMTPVFHEANRQQTKDTPFVVPVECVRPLEKEALN